MQSYRTCLIFNAALIRAIPPCPHQTTTGWHFTPEEKEHRKGKGNLRLSRTTLLELIGAAQTISLCSDCLERFCGSFDFKINLKHTLMTIGYYYKLVWCASRCNDLDVFLWMLSNGQQCTRATILPIMNLIAHFLLFICICNTWMVCILQRGKDLVRVVIWNDAKLCLDKLYAI